MIDEFMKHMPPCLWCPDKQDRHARMHWPRLEPMTVIPKVTIEAALVEAQGRFTGSGAASSSTGAGAASSSTGATGSGGLTLTRLASERNTGTMDDTGSGEWPIFTSAFLPPILLHLHEEDQEELTNMIVKASERNTGTRDDTGGGGTRSEVVPHKHVTGIGSGVATARW